MHDDAFIFFLPLIVTQQNVERACSTGMLSYASFAAQTQLWNSSFLSISSLTWTFSFLIEKSGANIALEQKLSKSGPAFSK